jgi:hypothetical protein
MIYRALEAKKKKENEKNLQFRMKYCCLQVKIARSAIEFYANFAWGDEQEKEK